MSNVQTVQDIYSAFGRGDVPAILNHLADDVVWEYDKAESKIPWLMQRIGRAEVPKFFHALGSVDFQKFEPKTMMEDGNIVVALIDVTFTVKETGISVVEEDEVHIWHFNAGGKVAKFCHKTDTYLHWAAIQKS